ncbi:head-tail connector protein [Lentibacter algarum]|uniref:head-tail connector protein n=1 Tax=Lentibacter algarum TaxID=576131 RepID=UPI001C08BF88|nr:head-tail connector protein [Lentibacter algarum]MBU2982737.1 head-tail connector protein [Lentibacter algarum]
MMLTEETAVPTAALPVEAFKAHLRLGTGFAEGSLQDAVLESFLRAALSAIEARTGKILIERDFSWSLTKWRDETGQALPVAPVSAVSSVTYYNRNDEADVLAANYYKLVQDMQRPRLCPVASVLPCVPSNGSVKMRFTAGFGPNWDDLPGDIAQAVLLLAAYYYEYRNETSVGEGYMPFGVSSLIERYRTVRLFAGAGQ